jgi:mevalonate kinase
VLHGRAPGKLILLGEHAVVYGHRALASPVSLGTRVSLEPCAGPSHLGDSSIQDARLEQALAVALPAQGWRVHIETDLPIGRGMGSSAALTIALLRAADAISGQRSTFEELHARGFPIEAVFHGNPSGLDHAVSALGCAVVYRKGQAPEAVAMPAHQVVVLDTGVAGDTRELVAGVASRRPRIEPSLQRLGALVEEALPVLSDPLSLGELMNEAQVHLETIGVSTPKIQELVSMARAAGATGAKLSGAGGGGIVLALTPQGPEQVLAAAAERGIDAFACTLGEH